MLERLRHPARILALAVPLLVCLFPAFALGAAADLDATFNATGTFRAPNDRFSPPYLPVVQAYEDIAVQADGSYVAIARNSSYTDQLHVERRLADGTLDPTFAVAGTPGFTDGMTLIAGEIVHPWAVTIGPNGRIYVAGNLGDPASGSAYNAFIARLRPNGTLDPTYSGDGVAVADPAVNPAFTGNESARELLVESSGRVTAVGVASNQLDPSPTDDFLVMRTGNFGVFDATLLGRGAIATSVIAATYREEARALDYQGDGKLLVAGITNASDPTSPDALKLTRSGAIIRYRNDGTIDTTFGTNGRFVVIDRGGVPGVGVGGQLSTIDAIRVTDAGLLVAGSTGRGADIRFWIGRLLADATWDPSFGAGGATVFDIAGGGADYLESMAPQSDGSIVLVGRSSDASDRERIAVARVYADGVVDTSFGGSGSATYSVVDDDESALALAVDAQDRIVTVGRSCCIPSGTRGVWLRLQGTLAPPRAGVTDGSNDDGSGDGSGDDGTGTPGATGPVEQVVNGTSGIDRITGTARDELLQGWGGRDTLSGGDGNDRIFGGLGNDLLRGGAGKDTLRGQDGDDRLFGDAGNDVVDGGVGDDVVVGGAGVDRLVGGPGRDRITCGRDAVDLPSAGPGNDVVLCRNGRRERIFCGSGRDVVVADRNDVAVGCERVRRP